MDVTKLYDQWVVHHFDQDLFGIYGQSRDVTLQQIREALDGSPHKVLDIGMGTGTLLAMLHRLFLGAQLVGLEPSEKMAAVARAKFAAQGIERAKIVSGKVEDLKRLFPEAGFDLITLHYVMNYVDPRRALQDIHDVLLPGGYLSVASCTQECFPTLFGMARNFITETFIREQLAIPRDLAELGAAVRGAGLEIITITPFRQRLVFGDYDHLKDFALHSGWLVHPFLGDMPEEIDTAAREFMRGSFPMEEWFVSGLLLARRPRA